MSDQPVQKRVRDPRLDFFRGVTMFIIFVAHVPDDAWNDWIPARFGFSSGSELFVFCSGCASAIAFGSVFVRQTWLMGTARIVFRIWQVYWAHVSLLIACASIAALADQTFAGAHFFADQFAPLAQSPGEALLLATTLRWLPDYLDILPMYIAILGFIPVMMAARALHPIMPFILSAGAYVLVWTVGLALPGNTWSAVSWFFNPFGWQLIFFTGFALMMGWLPHPPLGDRRWMRAAIGFLVLSVPLAFWGIRTHSTLLTHLYEGLFRANEKTDFHPLRYLHFMALLYVTLSLVDHHRERLATGFGTILVKVGQQSLATFLASIVMARIAWIGLDLAGRSWATVGLANFAGLAGVVAVAYTVGWFKSTPWTRHATFVAEAQRASLMADAQATV